MSDEPQQQPYPQSTAPENGANPEQQEREWVQVPQPTTSPAPSHKSGGKMLAITAMALGLVALLSAVIAGLYMRSGLFFAGALGLAAIVVGIIALVKRSRPKSAGVSGIITGVLSLLVAFVMAVVGVFSFAIDLLNDIDSTEITEEWVPDDEQESLVKWPANMASGGILFTAESGAPAPREAAPLEQGMTPTPNEVHRTEGKNDIQVYFDYSCPYCAGFEAHNGAFLEEKLLEGASIEITPLSFLDSEQVGPFFSSRAAGALACVVDGQPAKAWDTHRALLSDDMRALFDADGVTNEEIVSVLDAQTGGLDSAAVDCIASDRFATFAKALSSWAIANPIPHAVDSSLRVKSVPFVLVNGVLFEGDPTDPAEFAAFYEEQTN